MMDKSKQKELVIVVDRRDTAYTKNPKMCRGCGLKLTKDNCHHTTWKNNGVRYLYHRPDCRKCESKVHNDYYLLNRDKIRDSSIVYLQRLKETEEGRGKILNIRKKNLQKQRILRDKYRDIIFEAYGARCVCCLETIRKFLTIDHVSGNGNVERKEFNGLKMYAKIIHDGFTNKYRILCWNCNTGRYHNGGICPHEEIRQLLVAN